MDERFVKTLLLLSFMVVILSIISYEFKSFFKVLFVKKNQILIIGILSSPDHFQQRISIRKTWLQLLSEISGSSYFIIGSKICDVPPLDRADPYSCIDKPFLLSHNVTNVTEFSTIKIQIKDSKLKAPIPSFVGFGFYVRSKVKVKKLGVFKEFLRLFNTEIQVKLISAFDNKVLATATFDPELINGTDFEFIIKSITPIILPKYYEAFVKLEVKQIYGKFFPRCDNIKWENGPNVINFIHLWKYDSFIPKPFTKKSCSFVIMIYSALELENIQENINNRNSRIIQWQQLNKKLQHKLLNESKYYNDLMFLDVVDVYKNLSVKIIQFFKRILETEYFHYVLKADDDSFIDLLRIYNQLKEISEEYDKQINQNVDKNRKIELISAERPPKFWWWSSFKEFWKVERSGKWREDQYQSPSYPTFPCGGGYVINKNIIDYIVSNEHNLNHFQGEDVSLGIWLSSLPVTQYKTNKIIPFTFPNDLQKKIITRFQGRQLWMESKKKNKSVSNLCDWTCNNERNINLPFCNKVQLSTQDMYYTWTEYINNGYL